MLLLRSNEGKIKEQDLLSPSSDSDSSSSSNIVEDNQNQQPSNDFILDE
jgi:hypothetical protein